MRVRLLGIRTICAVELVSIHALMRVRQCAPVTLIAALKFQSTHS